MTQPFEAFPKLAGMIENLGWKASGVSLGAWGAFLAEINATITSLQNPWHKLSEALPPHGRVVLFFIPTDIADDGTLRNWKKCTGSYHEAQCEYLQRWSIDGSWLEPRDAPPTHWCELPGEPV